VSIFSTRVLHPDFSFKPAVINVSGSTILSVESGERPPVLAPNVLDLGDRPVTPAFINAHTHLPMAAMRGIEGCATAMAGDVVKDLYFEVEKRLSPEDVKAFARMGCYENLLNGTALVWEHYYHGMALAEALLETGLAGVVCPTLQDLSGPGVPWLEDAFNDTKSIARNASMKDRGVFAALGPHATDTVSDSLWQRIVQDAKALGNLPVHFHVGQGILEVEMVHNTNGTTPIGKLEANGVLSSGLPLLLVHGQFATATDVELLDREKHILCVCPRSHMLFAFPTSARRWHSSGIRLALGTDAAASNDDMNVQTELRMLAGLPSFEATSSEQAERLWRARSADKEEVLRAAQALHNQRQAVHQSKCAEELRDDKRVLQSVWNNPGTLHPQFRAGVLEAGALANIVIWDDEHPSLWPASDMLHALVMNDATPAIDGLLVCGRWIGRTPEASGADGMWQSSIRKSTAYKAALADASSRYQALLKHLGSIQTQGVKRKLDDV